MQLLFFLGNDLIESVWLDPEKISTPGYLGAIKRNMQRKHQSTIMEQLHLPEFLVMPSTSTSSKAPSTRSYSYAAA